MRVSRPVAIVVTALVAIIAGCRTLGSADVQIKSVPITFLGIRLDRPRMELTQTVSSDLAYFYNAVYNHDADSVVGVFCDSAGARARAFMTAIHDQLVLWAFSYGSALPSSTLGELANALSAINQALALPASQNALICRGLLGSTRLDPNNRNAALLPDLGGLLRNWDVNAKQCLTLTVSLSKPDGAVLNWSYVTSDLNNATAIQYANPTRAWVDIYDTKCALGAAW